MVIPPSRSRWATSLTLVVVFFALSGCGVSSAHSPSSSSSTLSPSFTTSSTASSPYRYLTSRDLDKQILGSPGRAVLQFWQNVQYQNFPAALAQLTPGFVSAYAHNLDHFALYVSAEQARWLVKPTIQSSTITGQTATVLISYPFGGIQTPTVFDLTRRNGVWLISYNFYLVSRLTARVATTKR